MPDHRDPRWRDGRDPMTHVDPVCGMEIEEADAVGTHRHNGTTYYFCHPSCLERFEKNPNEFLEPAAPATPAPVGATFICPMDPEVRSDRPGACPDMRDGARTRPLEPRRVDEDRIYLPDASGDCSGRARSVPDLRHGAGTAHGLVDRRAQSRARRHDAAVPDRRRADRSRVRRHHGEHGRWPRAAEATTARW